MSQSPLSIAQPSSSFKRLDMRTFMYAIRTLITEALCLVTQVQLFLMTYSELTPYIALAYSYWVSVYDVYQFQGYAH